MNIVKISQLPTASILNGSEMVLIVQNGVTKTAPAALLSDNAPVRKPYALEPIDANHYSQLRLSSFLPGIGFDDMFHQTAVLFQMYRDSKMAQPVAVTGVIEFPLLFGLPDEYEEPDPSFIKDVGGVVVHTRNIFQIPVGVFEDNTTFYWRAKYISNNNQESVFSDLFQQTYSVA